MNAMQSSDNVWRATMRALIVSVATMVAQTAASLPVAIVFFLFSVIVTHADPRDVSQHLEDSMLWLNAITALVTFLAILALIALALRWLDQRGTFQDLGWHRSYNAKNVFVAATIASASIIVLIGAMLASGSMRVTGMLWQREGWSDVLADFVGGLIFLICSVLTEELVFRGYIRFTLTNALGARGAIFGAAILFALFRLFTGAVARLNAMELLLAGLTALVAGLVLGEIVLSTQSLWTAIGAHFAWNFIGGFIFSMPVAGTPIDGLIGTESSIGLITGGRFGLEGGFAGLIGLGLIGIALAIAQKK